MPRRKRLAAENDPSQPSEVALVQRPASQQLNEREGYREEDGDSLVRKELRIACRQLRVRLWNEHRSRPGHGAREVVEDAEIEVQRRMIRKPIVLSETIFGRRPFREAEPAPM
jgi:hypothetical protein